MALEPRRCNFVIGQKVVCIADDWGSYTCGEYMLPTRVPMMNEVLTIVGIRAEGAGIYLLFREIDQHQTDGPFSGDIAWEHGCFRPLVVRKADISQFMALLDIAGAKELV